MAPRLDSLYCDICYSRGVCSGCYKFDMLSRIRRLRLEFSQLYVSDVSLLVAKNL